MLLSMRVHRALGMLLPMKDTLDALDAYVSERHYVKKSLVWSTYPHRVLGGLH